MGYLLASQPLAWNFWLGLIYFSFSYNLLLYGLGHIYGRPSSKKETGESAAETLTLPSKSKALWYWIAATNLPFILYFLLTGPTTVKLAVGIIVLLALGYQVKGLRFKEIPLLDAIISSLLFVSPFIFGLVLAGSSAFYWQATVAFFLWGVASYSFRTIQYSGAYRAKKIRSTATYLGVRRTASLSFWLYLLSAVIIGITYGPGGVTVASLMLLYALNVSFFKKYKSDAQSNNYRRGWKNFLWLNFIVGFWVGQIVLFTLDPFKLGPAKITIMANLLIGLSIIESLLIAHNLLGFSRPKTGRLAEWPKISILIHAYNQADNIASTILALIGQNYPDFEIIFTDLGSTDNTLKIVEGYDDPRLRIVTTGELKKGWTLHAHAADALLKVAKGEIAILLGPDTVLKPNALSTFAAILDTHKLDLISILPSDQDKTVAQKLILSQNQFLLLGAYPTAYLTKNYPKLASTYAALAVFKTDKINSIDGFESVKKSPLEDLDLAAQAKARGLKTSFYLGSDIAISQNHANLKLILEQNNRRFYPTLHFSMPLTIGLITGGLFLFCTPLALLLYQVLLHNAESIIGLIIVLAIGLINRIVVAMAGRQSLLGCFLYPITSFIALVEIFTSMLNYELLKPRWLERTEAH